MPAGGERGAVSPTDILIITATREEFDAARVAAVGFEGKQQGGGGTPSYWRGVLRSADGRDLSVALARPTRRGGRSLAPLATALVGELQPTCLAMCGVCAGNPSLTAPGDVVVAETAYEWDEGTRFGTSFVGDHRQFPLHPEWLRAAQDFDPVRMPTYGPASLDEALVWLLERLYRGQEPRDHPARPRYFPARSWSERLGGWEAEGLITHHGVSVGLTDVGRAMIQRRLYDDPDGPRRLPYAVHVAPMASGIAAMADLGVWDSLREMGMRGIAAVDLEAATLATIAHERRVPYWMVAKGVADHADIGREDRYRHFAATASAEVLFDLLITLRMPASIPKPVRGDRDSQRDKLRIRLVEALLDVPFMDGLADRRLLLNLIRRDEYRFPDVAERPEARLHVIGIVMACVERVPSLRALAAALEVMAPQSRGTRAVRAAVDTATLTSLLGPDELDRIRELLSRAHLGPGGSKRLGVESLTEGFEARLDQPAVVTGGPPAIRLLIEAAPWVGDPAVPQWAIDVADRLGLEIDAGIPAETEAHRSQVRIGVPARNSAFTGREAHLAHLSARFEERSYLPQALVDMGGMGKTAIAIEYAYRYADRYQLIFWVPADDRERVVALLAELANELGIDAGDSTGDAARATVAFLTGWQSERPWLLVFDGAGDPADLAEFFPSSDGHILVTSRDRSWMDRADATEVGVFLRPESVDYLAGRVPRVSGVDADRIAEYLCDLPVALDLAANRLLADGRPASEYLDLLSDARHRSSLLDADSAATVWQLALATLGRTFPGALMFLQVMGHLGIALPAAMLTRPPSEPITPELDRIFGSPVGPSDAMLSFGRWAVVRLDPPSGMIMVDPLVRDLALDMLDEEGRAHIRRAADLWAAVHPDLALMVEPAGAGPADRSAGARRMIVANDPRAVGELRSLVGSADEKVAADLLGEFAFLLDPIPELESAPARVGWITGVWTALSAGNGYELQAPEHDDETADVSVDGERADVEVRAKPVTDVDDPLEEAFLRVLRRICRISEPGADEVRRALRAQAAGPQYGHNLRVKGSALSDDTVTGELLFRCGTGALTVDDVGAAFLDARHRYADGGPDQLVVVSPHADPSFELAALVDGMNARQDCRFDIQIWSPTSGVDRLLAAEPRLYRTIYGRSAAAPDDAGVWAERLSAAVRLPGEWVRYLDSTSAHCLGGELWEHFSALLDDHIEPKVADDKGTTLDIPLSTAVRGWLSQDGARSLLLLAEFGEGKSFFTYWLSCQLGTEFLRNPRTGWLPLRLALRDLRSARGGREFVQRRLTDLGTTPAEWHRLSREYRTVVILDGFDEMSARMDPEAFRENLTLLASCYEYLDRSRILITSRTHFFESPRERERFLDRVGRPPTVRIAPIPRARSVTYLHAHAVAIGAEDRLRHLRTLYDPIGLAAKPLFLQMIKETLPALPDDRFDELVLYRTYVDRSLRRKIADLEDPDTQVLHAELLANLQDILELIAVELHLTDRGYVSLKAVSGQHDLPRKLWQMADSPSTVNSDDARARIGIRSLLKPAAADHDSWPVEFFHRSMREYFVACAIVRRLRSGGENRALDQVPLPPEVINFAMLLMRDDPGTDFAAVLLAAAHSATVGQGHRCRGGNALSLLYGHSGRLPTDTWTGLDLDYAYLAGADLSGMTFRGSTLRYANLDNTKLDRVDFSNADLTGVRLEETAAVRALAPVPGTAGVYSAYGDGTLREWRFGGPRQLTTHTLRSDLPSDLTAMVVGPFGDIVVFARGSVSVLVGSASGWRSVSTFRPRPEVQHVTECEGELVISAEIGAETRAVRYDPVGRQVRCVGPGLVDGPLVALAAGTFVVSGPSKRPDVLPVTGMTAVEARDLGSGRVLIVAGQQDGTMTGWVIADGGAPERLWATTVHTGSVASVRFVGDSFVVSGGADRSILIFPLAKDLSIGPPRRLHLSVRCEGMRFAGVAGPREAEMLRQLVEARP